MSLLDRLKNENNSPIFDQLNEELIEDYFKGSPCLEFEESMIISLFERRKYDTILSCFRRGFKWNPKFQDLILKSGNLSLYQYLMEINEFPTTDRDLLVYPAKTNNLDTIMWLVSTVKCPPSVGSLQISIQCENWDVYKWLFLALKRPYSLDLIIEKGNLEILEWAHQQYDGQYQYLFFDAIRCNQPEIFKWGLEHGYLLSPNLYVHALNYNNFDFVKLLYSSGCPWNPYCLTKISNQNRHICKWLIDHGCPMTCEIFEAFHKVSFLDRLICLKDLELIIYVVETHGAKISNQNFIFAARSDSSIMQYLYDTMPKEEMNLNRGSISYEAASNSNLEILNWLEANTLLPDRSYEPEKEYECIVNGALASGNLEIFQWVRNRGYKGTYYSLNFAIKHGWSLDIIKELREEGCPFLIKVDNETFQKAMERKDFEIIKYLVDSGCPHRKSDECFVIFCDDNNLDILEWFLSKGFSTGSSDPYCMSRACSKAYEMKQFKAFKWFFEHGFYCNLSYVYRTTDSKEIRDWIERGHRKFLKYQCFANITF